MGQCAVVSSEPLPMAAGVGWGGVGVKRVCHVRIEKPRGGFAV